MDSLGSTFYLYVAEKNVSGIKIQSKVIERNQSKHTLFPWLYNSLNLCDHINIYEQKRSSQVAGYIVF